MGAQVEEYKLTVTERASAALREQWQRPVTIQTDINHLVGLIGAVQLALRHPEARRSLSLQQTERMIRDLIEKVDPDHGDIWKFFNMGFNPNFDA